MNHSIIHKSLFLSERTGVDIDQYQLNAAEHYLSRKWKNILPFKERNTLSEKLDYAGISYEKWLIITSNEHDFSTILLKNEKNWLTEIENIYSTTENEKLDLLIELKKESESSFLTLILPLISIYRKKLTRKLRQNKISLNEKIDYSHIEPYLLNPLYSKLTCMLSPALVLELNIASHENQLDAESAEQRFCEFIKKLNNTDYRQTLIQEYPVLFRRVIETLNQWMNFSFDLIHHYTTDIDIIKKTILENIQVGKLIAIYSGQGDNHNDGKSVSILEFSNGSKIVYKPRSLAIDEHFQQLLKYLNESGAKPKMKTLRIVNSGTYGWVEYVPEKTCKTNDQVNRFYQRQGANIALLYLLYATDFHFENIIANGEYPVLIDLETLFHPNLPPINDHAFSQFAEFISDSSVMSIGLLPASIKLNENSTSIDLSGIGSQADQVLSNSHLYWKNAGSDKMMLAQKNQTLGKGKHLPTMNSSNVSPADYVDQMELGFKNMYRLLMHLKENLLKHPSPINAFANDKCRIILRPTQIYGTMLQDAYHPDMLRNALYQDQLFDMLWLETDIASYLKSLIQFEQLDLCRGDIPLFNTTIAGHHLEHRGAVIQTDFFKQSSLQLVKQRLNQLSLKDLERQCYFLNQSLASSKLNRNLCTNFHPKFQFHSNNIQKTALQLATHTADYLEILSYQQKDKKSWLTPTVIGENQWTLNAISSDLYDGQMGMCIFYAIMATLTENQNYRITAYNIANSVFQYHVDTKKQKQTIGAFQGLGGTVYAFTYLSILFQDESWVSRAHEICSYIPELIKFDNRFDIISGSAGSIVCLLRLYEQNPDKQLLETAILCGEHLLNNAIQMNSGVGWISAGVAEKPIAGFSHGGSGIAWSLFWLANISGDQRFFKMAKEAIKYEDSCYSSSLNHWLDLRNESTCDCEDKQLYAWCHGAPGIALGRHLISQYIEESNEIDYKKIAVEQSIKYWKSKNHSLCHGDIGNLDILLSVMQSDTGLRAPGYESELCSIIQDIQISGMKCGAPSGLILTGLMTGIAGIAYGVLRLAFPNRVPSILSLSLPNQAKI